MPKTLQTIPPPPLLKILESGEDDSSKDKPVFTGPFSCGAKTKIEAALIENGGCSMVQNMRLMRPGAMQRLGQAVLHTQPDGSNQVVSTYHFKKSNGSEEHFFAQMSDGDVLSATSIPPTVTTGVFGSEVFSGSSGQGPASWSTHKDMLLYSNGGADQHQIYAGDANELDEFVYCSDSSPALVTKGVSYINEVKSTNTSDVVTLDLWASGTDTGYFIRSSIPANKLTLALSAINSAAAVSRISYWNGAWTAVSGFSDLTSVGGKTLARDQDMTWTLPSDQEPFFLYGEYGYWIYWDLSSGGLDATVQLNTVTFGADWQNVRNVWDNEDLLPNDALVTVWANRASHAPRNGGPITYTCDPSSVVISDVADYGLIGDQELVPPTGYYLGFIVYFSSKTLLRGYSISLDDKAIGWKKGIKLYTASVWANGAWYAGGKVYEDGRADQSGWTIFNNSLTPELSAKFDATEKLYWYKFSFEAVATTSSDVSTAEEIVWPDETLVINLIPRYDIDDIGTNGLISTSWKDRAVYVFAEDPYKLHVSSSKNPFYLNGNDYSKLAAGDGRRNRIKCVLPYYNELAVFQEELGTDGGCITLFTGDSPGTYSKSVISHEIGTFNSKSAVVVDTVSGKKMYFISNRGIYESNGNGVVRISEDIQNYFDAADSNSLRRGYEDEHWIAFDPRYDIIRGGMVCGDSATVPNIFLVYDIAKEVWGFDVLGQPLSCITQADAGSGDADVLSTGGGVDDGTVYLLNSGDNDVSTAIDAYVTKELNLGGLWFSVDKKFILRMKAQTAGSVVITPYTNGAAESSITKSMKAEKSGETLRRHRIPLSHKTSHLSLKFRNNTASESLYLLDSYIPCKIYENK